MGEDELNGDEWDVFHFCQLFSSLLWWRNPRGLLTLCLWDSHLRPRFFSATHGVPNFQAFQKDSFDVLKLVIWQMKARNPISQNIYLLFAPLVSHSLWSAPFDWVAMLIDAVSEALLVKASLNSLESFLRRTLQNLQYGLNRLESRPRHSTLEINLQRKWI